MGYKLKDSFEAAVGAFSAVLLFFALRSDPITIDPRIGLAITLVWVFLFYNGDGGIKKKNFFINFIIAGLISGFMTLVFGLASKETLLSFDYFGSTAIIGLWLGFPISLLMDKFNMTNILRRHYIRR